MQAFCDPLRPPLPLASPLDGLSLTGHLLSPCEGLQGTPLSHWDFSWFTDGSYLKGDNGKY